MRISATSELERLEPGIEPSLFLIQDSIEEKNRGLGLLCRQIGVGHNQSRGGCVCLSKARLLLLLCCLAIRS